MSIGMCMYVYLISKHEGGWDINESWISIKEMRHRMFCIMRLKLIDEVDEIIIRYYYVCWWLIGEFDTPVYTGRWKRRQTILSQPKPTTHYYRITNCDLTLYMYVETVYTSKEY